MQSLQRAQLGLTIAAQSTARGMGAIGIVRLSGSEAFTIGAALGCRSPQAQPYKLQRALLRNAQGAALDDAMAVAMPAPNSYTGEDLLELHVHGGEAVVAAVLQACLAAGARAAEPGEFTLRAFVHGRMDLAQAEAVGALIHAQTDAGRARALAVLQGDVSTAIGTWLQRLEGVAAAWLAQLDFPDDTLEGPGVTQTEQQACLKAHEALERLLGRMALDDEQPPHVVLLGAVNTGKSTLTNALCGYERALVDADAGTTRDAIEVPLRWRHQRLNWWDTAGRRQGAEGVEARGITLGAERAQSAALIVWLCAAEAPLWPPQELLQKGAPVLLLGAQADRLDAAARADFAASALRAGHTVHGFVSGKTGEGITQLQQLVCDGLTQGHTRGAVAANAPDENATLGNLRHREQLSVALEALGDVEASFAGGMPLDVLLMDLQRAIRALGQIVGRDVDARVIDRIFSDFCIGK